ncbi:MAG: hypothetical protein JSR46_08395 [Verrucomicrobia bacterium]|nr:hypothetical protein [Verrucomicrobiota bacterium]
MQKSDKRYSPWPRSLFEVAFKMDDAGFISRKELVKTENIEPKDQFAIITREYNPLSPTSQETTKSTLNEIFESDKFKNLSNNEKTNLVTDLIKNLGKIKSKQPQKELNILDAIHKKGIAAVAREQGRFIGIGQTADNPVTDEKTDDDISLSREDLSKYEVIGILFKPLYEMNNIDPENTNKKQEMVRSFSKEHNTIEFPAKVPIH